MHEMLEHGVPHTAQAKAYLDRVAGLRPAVDAALEAVRSGKPNAEGRVQQAAHAVARMWEQQIGELPEILVLERPLPHIPAMKPYLMEPACPSRIVAVDPKRPEDSPRVVLFQPDLAIYDMSLSYDARTIFFSASRVSAPAGSPERMWQIYEIGVDGKNLKEITKDQSLNISPAELPSGEIIFVSTRMGSYLQCQAGPAGLLYGMRRDGSQVRRLSNNIDSDHTPRVMNDGRILFSRWDYGIEKGVFARHALWTMNPDDSLTGTLVVEDVYQGVGRHIERGRVASIQIMEQLFKTRSRTGPAAPWSISPIMSRGTYHARRLIGTVPVESDGSAHFSVPALRDISLNLLDAQGKVLTRMGSDMQVMPGETQGCIGCHEYRDRWKAPTGTRLPQALRRPPSKPERPDWGTLGLVDFPRVIQPVLDKHCGQCHSGPLPQGGLDLSGDKTRFFSMGYDNLLQRDLVDYTEMTVTEHDEGTPLTTGSLLSRLCEYVESPKHGGYVVPLEDRRRIYTWIDANIPYYSTYVYSPNREHTQGNRDAWDGWNPNGWFQKGIVPAFRRRCFDCHQRTVPIQQWSFGGVAVVTSKYWPARSLWFEQQHGLYRGQTYLVGPESRINLTHPEWSLLLTAPLSKQSGGFGFCKEKTGVAVFKDKSDPDYGSLLGAIRQGHDELYAHPVR